MNEIVLIGDSIRMGYQETVRSEIGALAPVWGPAENGGTSRNVLAHLDEWVISRAPRLVHLNCGLHDVKKELDAPQPAVPLDEYRSNLTQILGRIRSETQAALIWATSTPSNEERHREKKGFDRFGADILAYNRASVEIAASLGIPVNDLYQAVTAAGRDSLLSEDGVHFTQDGYTLLGKTVAQAIRSALEGGG